MLPKEMRSKKCTNKKKKKKTDKINSLDVKRVEVGVSKFG